MLHLQLLSPRSGPKADDVGRQQSSDAGAIHCDKVAGASLLHCVDVQGLPQQQLATNTCKSSHLHAN